jgi:hypothetical protein
MIIEKYALSDLTTLVDTYDDESGQVGFRGVAIFEDDIYVVNSDYINGYVLEVEKNPLLSVLNTETVDEADWGDPFAHAAKYSDDLTIVSWNEITDPKTFGNIIW